MKALVGIKPSTAEKVVNVVPLVLMADELRTCLRIKSKELEQVDHPNISCLRPPHLSVFHHMD